MKLLAATLASLTLVGSSATAQEESMASRAQPGVADIRTVAPALEKYTQDRLLGDVWSRPGLSARDRSVVTVAALIARNQTIELATYMGIALDNGVKPAELS